MILHNAHLALQSLKTNKVRSLLTVMGVVVGIGSVLIVASLGEGFKNQIKDQVKKWGDDLITIQPGSVVSRNKNGSIDGLELTGVISTINSANLTEKDTAAVSESKFVKVLAPLVIVNGIAKSAEASMNDGVIVGTNENFPAVMGQKTSFGEFFTKNEYQKSVVVIGADVAEALFREEAPIGKSLIIKDQTYFIRGVMARFDASTLVSGININKTVFMPLPAAKFLSADSLQIAKIFVKPQTGVALRDATDDINRLLRASHGGKIDFTVLTQDEAVSVAKSLVSLSTGFIGGVAAISLLVGGIGVMNIMLLSVSERTREIGIRKSIGATSRQILSQFLLESIVLTTAGGMLAIITNGIVVLLVRYLTIYKPVITLPMVGLSFGVCFLVGLVFGFVPAFRAARKNPIQALRF